MKKIFFIVSLIMAYLSHRASDSLKVYIVGDFSRREHFKIYTPGKTYIINGSKNKFCSIKAWYFYLPIDSTIKDCSLLPIVIEKCRGRRSHDVRLKCYFQTDRKYFILWKDYRQSSKYPFIELWSKFPFGSAFISKEFWEGTYNSKFVPQYILELNSPYQYFFEHLEEF
ncbi:MAG: hypothetical protein JST26_12915 [Bacteroidetes bacterium]|nr:hypothetical protein [Bacteroidota bacterium]